MLVFSVYTESFYNKSQLQAAYFTYSFFLTLTYVSKNAIFERKFILNLRCNIFMVYTVDWKEVQTEIIRKLVEIRLNLHVSSETTQTMLIIITACITWTRELTVKSFIDRVRESISLLPWDTEHESERIQKPEWTQSIER